MRRWCVCMWIDWGFDGSSIRILYVQIYRTKVNFNVYILLRLRLVQMKKNVSLLKAQEWTSDCGAYALNKKSRNI